MDNKQSYNERVNGPSLPSPALRSNSLREGVALCLSGGGYRAALFHLGALRRLCELGILQKLTAVSSVSGGSIMAAHVATVLALETDTAWPSTVSEFDAKIAEPFRRLMAKDIRTKPVLNRLLPWNWLRRSTQVSALAATYSRELTDLGLRDLPEQPRFILCASELTCGVNWVFERGRVGQYWLGYQSPPPNWPLAKAVAASSCFPPIFDPMTLDLSPRDLTGGKLEPGDERDRLIAGLRLSDGGVYDNLGLEPVWDTYHTLLVSDGGSPFRLELCSSILQQWKRYFEITGNQVVALRKRWLIANFERSQLEGAYWGIGSAVTSYGRQFDFGYSKQLAKQVIARIRTDMDGFSEAEMAVLENHGYLLTDAALRRHVAQLVPSNLQPARVPYPEFMDEGRVREVLRDSHKRFRFLSSACKKL